MGTGYVGLVTGTCLAEIGHRVVSVDDDPEKIATVIFICVGTPPLEDGDADLSAVEQVARQELPSLVYCQNPYEAASGADALVVATGGGKSLPALT